MKQPLPIVNSQLCIDHHCSGSWEWVPADPTARIVCWSHLITLDDHPSLPVIWSLLFTKFPATECHHSTSMMFANPGGFGEHMCVHARGRRGDSQRTIHSCVITNPNGAKNDHLHHSVVTLCGCALSLPIHGLNTNANYSIVFYSVELMHCIGSAQWWRTKCKISGVNVCFEIGIYSPSIS